VVNNAVVADQPYHNPQSVWGAFTQSAPRYGHTRIDSLDFRFSGEALRLWSGAAGVSFGAEWRRERKDDDEILAVTNEPEPAGQIGRLRFRNFR